MRQKRIALYITRLITAWQLVVKRAVAHWRLLSTVVVGVVMASAIMAGTVIYFDALRTLALKVALGKLNTEQSDILLRTERGPTNADEYGRLSSLVDSEVNAWVSFFLSGRERAGRSATFFVSTVENVDNFDEIKRSNARSYFAFIPGFEDRITLLPGGRMPREQAHDVTWAPLVLEAIIPFEAAELFDIGVGDRLAAIPFWEDATPYVAVIVSGIFVRNDPDDELWRMDDTTLRASTRLNFRAVQFQISEKTFLEVLGPTFRQMDSSYAWLLKTGPGKITARNATKALVGVRTLQARLAEKTFAYDQATSLDDSLLEHERRLFFAKVPMFVVLILIAVVILYYVVTLSSMLAEQQRSEIALLRSRGATSSQILTVFVLEGATISVLATVAGPIIAALAISLLGYLPAFSDLSGGERLSVNINSGAFMMSALGGVLSFVALMIPAFQASRIGVTRHRQETARPIRLPAFQRYYLDVALLIVAIFLFRQLREQGSVIATRLFGGVALDELLLAVPAVVLVASAMVMLRLFPLAMNLGSRLLSNWLPAGLVLGLWQMARNPTHYARLSLLLILVAGLGIFVASLGGTLKRSFEERVFYSTGSDVRVEGIALNRLGLSQPLALTYQRIPGVSQAVNVYRGRGLDLSTFFGTSFLMFAMDQDNFKDVAWFRDDFSDKSMDELLASLKAPEPPQGIELPLNAVSIEVMVKPNRSHPTMRLLARIRDANGRHYTYSLGSLESREWTRLVGGIFERTWPPSGVWLVEAAPLTLVSLVVTETDFEEPLRSGSVLIDNIRITTKEGITLPLESFEDTSDWSVLRAVPSAVRDELHFADVSFDGDSGSALFSWASGSSRTGHGIVAGRVSPMPVLTNKSFLNESLHSLGSELDVTVGPQQVRVRLVGEIDYFPTLDTINRNWMIADLASLTRYANLDAMRGEVLPNEAWLIMDADGSDRTQLVESFVNEPFESEAVHDRVQELAASQVDPLVDAGWRALLFIAFATVLLLSCIGFLVHAYVSFQDREGQFALLRTIGLSMRQLITLVWLEQVLVIVAGMAVGTWMGGRLAETIMPFIGHDDRGSQVLPPYAIDVNWTILAGTYLAMAFVFSGIILGIIFLIRNLSLHRVLRLGDL